MTIKRLPARAQIALGTFVEQLFGGLGELWGGPPANASTAGGDRGSRGGDLRGVAGVAKVVARIAAAALATTMAAQVCLIPAAQPEMWERGFADVFQSVALGSSSTLITSVAM